MHISVITGLLTPGPTCFINCREIDSFLCVKKWLKILVCGLYLVSCTNKLFFKNGEIQEIIVNLNTEQILRSDYVFRCGQGSVVMLRKIESLFLRSPW